MKPRILSAFLPFALSIVAGMPHAQASSVTSTLTVPEFSKHIQDMAFRLQKAQAGCDIGDEAMDDSGGILVSVLAKAVGKVPRKGEMPVKGDQKIQMLQDKAPTGAFVRVFTAADFRGGTNVLKLFAYDDGFSGAELTTAKGEKYICLSQ